MSTEYKGKVYILHIKHSSDRDWESDDLVYAIANDGGKGFSYSDFKRACFLNKRFFLAKKAGKDEKKCYWKDIEDAMQLEPAVGSPKLVHVSSVISFLDLAHMLYTDGYFDNKEIYEIINEREKILSPRLSLASLHLNLRKLTRNLVLIFKEWWKGQGLTVTIFNTLIKVI